MPNRGPTWRRYLRFPTHVSLQSCGAAVRGRNYDLLHVPGSPCAIQRGFRFCTNRHFFIVCFAAGLGDLWQQVFRLVSTVAVLVSVCYIDLLSVLVLRLSYLCFGSRKWCSECKKLSRSMRIVCGRCSLFRDYCTDDV